MSPITPPGETRNRVYRFIHQRLMQGRPPTVREVQKAMGFRAVQTAATHLTRLVEEGRLTKEQGKSRGYRLPGPFQPRGTRLVPVLGRVQAGGLSAAVEDLEGYVPVQTRASDDEVFGLRVRGESMTGVGILPGDIVIVRAQRAARSGDIVVALVGDEATVKTLRVRRGKVHLQPANAAYDTIVPESCTILGKVIEVRRYLESAPR